MKICSLYGVGFYYIPGTDMCLKIGGWVRAEYIWGGNGSFAWGWANGNANNLSTNNSTFRARGYITADARNQTPYGTVRSYIAVGLSENDVGFNTPANTFSANRAFIQWAGFTFGRAQSFYDFYSVPATSYWGAFPASDTGDPGWLVMGYTAQFGNGFSATISAEERRMTQIIGTSDAETAFLVPLFASTQVIGAAGTAVGGAYGGFQSPDVVANVRVDQAWGSAQLMGAWHDVNAMYYESEGEFQRNAAGHADNESGWVVGAGLKLNTPFFSPGDYFQSQVNYTEGALRYIFQTPNSNWGKVEGDGLGYGVLSDCVYGGSVSEGDTTKCELTTAWNVNAAYEHFWSPQWRTSIYGGYAEVTYNDSANAMLCVLEHDGGGEGTGAVANAGCNNNWKTWWIGSRTQWNVTSDFYMGVDVLYSKLMSASSSDGTIIGSGLLTAAQGGPGCEPGAPCLVKDVDNFAVRFRVHKDFYP